MKNSAQISMSTERRKSKKRLITWLTQPVRRDVARREEGQREGDERTEQRAEEGHDDGLQQLGPDVAMLPFVVVPEVVEGERQIGLRPASSRGAGDDQADDLDSPDLSKKGDCVSKMKLAQPRKRLRIFTRSVEMLTSPAKPILARILSS